MNLRLTRYKQVGLSIIFACVCALLAGVFVAAKKAAVQAPQFKFRVNARDYIVSSDPFYQSDYITYRITGAAPNSPITFKQWKDGQYHGQFSGGNTDANGNWTALDWLGNYPATALVGHWKREYFVAGKSDPYEWDYISYVPGRINYWYCHSSSVNKCLQISQERRQGLSGNTVVAEPSSTDTPITYNLNEVKSHCLAVQFLPTSAPGTTPPPVTVHDTQNDQLITYLKIKVTVLREPTQPCNLCSNSPTYPSSLDPVAADQVILVYPGTVGGLGLLAGNIRLLQARRGYMSGNSVLLLRRNKFNPKIVYLAGGPSAIYPIGFRFPGNIPVFTVNNHGNGYVMNVKHGLHPLMALNPVPNDPSTSDDLSMDVSQLQTILNQ
jgi:hypothetical protein